MVKLETEHIGVVYFFKVLLFPLGRGVLADGLLLWELHIAQGPVGRHLGDVAQEDLDFPGSVYIANGELDLVLRLVVLGHLLGEEDYLWSQQLAIQLELLSISILERSNQLSFPLVLHDHGPFV